MTVRPIQRYFKGAVVVQEVLSLLLKVIMIVLATTSIVVSQAFEHPFSKESLGKNSVLQSGPEPDFLMQLQPSYFRMTNGSSAQLGVVFTAVNGFVGNVSLSANVYPTQSSGPTISLNAPTISLDAQFNPSSYWMQVNTTSETETGLYNITLTGYSRSISHSATAVVGVTGVIIPPGTAYLEYKGHFTSAAYAGRSTVLASTFEDLGYTAIGITSLAVTLDFGVYKHSSPSLPCISAFSGPCLPDPFVSISPYEAKRFDLTIQIPNDTYAGNHKVTVSVTWDYNSQLPPDLVAYGNLTTHPKLSSPTPNNASSIFSGLVKVFLIPILLGTAMVAMIAVTVEFWNRRRFKEKTQTMLQFVARSIQAQSRRTCLSCGATTILGAKFCETCGQPISPTNPRP